MILDLMLVSEYNTCKRAMSPEKDGIIALQMIDFNIVFENALQETLSKTILPNKF